MNVGNEIANAFAQIQIEDAIEVQLARRREAMEVLRTIESGTTDDELTTKQRRALDQYEDANRRLANLRGQP